MKVIFLDIDGVLNNPGTYSNESTRKKFPLGYWEPTMVHRLNRIIAETGAFIVLSSSWRYGLGSQGEIKALLNKIMKIKGKILGKTPELPTGGTRGDEIKAWFAKSLPTFDKIESFIILDDYKDFGDLQDYHYHVNGYCGLLEEDLNLIINQLNNKGYCLKTNETNGAKS